MRERLVGTWLGPFRIEALIGRGGMAAVYRGYHPALNRYIAVKVLAASPGSDANAAARFRREAVAVARLQHPHILPVHDFGEQEGLLYLVMPLVEGGTLDDRIGLPLPLDWSIDICRQVAAALDYAHGHGIVPRDVKPRNILLGPGDAPLLADFGIASQAGHGRGLTQLGMGTAEYMSPEQGRGLRVDGRSNQYALAITCYQMLAGHVPFWGPTAIATALLHCNAPVPSLRAHNPDVPPAVDAVLQWALAKPEVDRFPTVGAFVDALDEAAQSRGAPFTPAAPRSEAPQVSASGYQPTSPTMAFDPPTAPVPAPGSAPAVAARPRLPIPFIAAIAIPVLIVALVFVVRAGPQIPTASPPGAPMLNWVPARRFRPRRRQGHPC